MTFLYRGAFLLAAFLLILINKRKRFLHLFILLPFLFGCSTFDHSKDVKTEDQIVRTANSSNEKYDQMIIKMKDKVLIDAPIINQMPELPRGCEVTSLAMLLKHANVDVDKMVLAKEVKKDPTPYKVKNGVITFGHPNYGFVGDMYSFENPGLGVYHKPIKELAEQYLPGRVIDLTGSEFSELKIHLSDNRPIWVIINTAYKKLPDRYFQTWQTPHGEVKITYKEHSVLVTGYDENYVYFNDPLTGEKNRKVDIKGFEDAWIQMGRQAITYFPN